MCRHQLPFEFPGHETITVREAFDMFSERRAIPVSIMGFSYELTDQHSDGSKVLDLVPAADSTINAELVPLDPGAPRRRYRTLRGVPIGMTLAGTHEPGQDTSGYGRFWFRQLADDSWVVEYELAACPACATATLSKEPRNCR